jgi:hypothetical protein
MRCLKEWVGGNQLAQTPQAIFDAIERLCLPGGVKFTWDPCPVNPGFDGLITDWGQYNYVNPEYNNIPKWLAKARAQVQLGCLSVFLIPFRPTTKYFSTMLLEWPEVREVIIIRDRITFTGYKKPARFQNCIVVIAPPPPHGHPRVTQPWLHIYKSDRSQMPHEVAQQLCRPFTTVFLDSTQPWIGDVFCTTTRNLSGLPARAKAHAATGHAVDLLIPIRDATRCIYEIFLSTTHPDRPSFVAFINPHLIMNGKSRSPFPSMLCSWTTCAEPEAIGCHPVLVPVRTEAI